MVVNIVYKIPNSSKKSLFVYGSFGVLWPSTQKMAALAATIGCFAGGSIQDLQGMQLEPHLDVVSNVPGGGHYAFALALDLPLGASTSITCNLPLDAFASIELKFWRLPSSVATWWAIASMIFIPKAIASSLGAVAGSGLLVAFVGRSWAWFSLATLLLDLAIVVAFLDAFAVVFAVVFFIVLVPCFWVFLGVFLGVFR